MKLEGKFYVEHYDKNGILKDKYELKNAVKTDGKTFVLSNIFNEIAAHYPYYIGLIDAAGWTSDPNTDTLNSHTGWTEFTNYTGNRKSWGEDAASGGVITNSTPITFAITGTGTLKGIFVASVATGTSGLLWSTANFTTPLPVISGDTLRINYVLAL